METLPNNLSICEKQQHYYNLNVDINNNNVGKDVMQISALVYGIPSLLMSIRIIYCINNKHNKEDLSGSFYALFSTGLKQVST